jgi:hypothetical protein
MLHIILGVFKNSVVIIVDRQLKHNTTTRTVLDSYIIGLLYLA